MDFHCLYGLMKFFNEGVSADYCRIPSRNAAILFSSKSSLKPCHHIFYSIVTMNGFDNNFSEKERYSRKDF